MLGLSLRQKQIVHFIDTFTASQGHAPSYREIKNFLKVSSLATVHKHIQTLIKKGAIESLPQSSRSISLKKDALPKSLVNLSLMGYVRAGYPLEMMPIPQSIAVPMSMVNFDQTTYLLRAKGDSLHEELIFDGDLLIVEARQPYFDGETVLCVVNQGDTMIKKLFTENEYARLEGKTAEHYPILIKLSDLNIVGIITGLIRLYN